MKPFSSIRRRLHWLSWAWAAAFDFNLQFHRSRTPGVVRAALRNAWEGRPTTETVRREDGMMRIGLSEDGTEEGITEWLTPWVDNHAAIFVAIAGNLGIPVQPWMLTWNTSVIVPEHIRREIEEMAERAGI